MTLLEAAIERSAYGSVPVLHDVNVHADGGEIVGVLGSNGVGKTTLLRTISGVQVHARASILLDGVEVSGHAGHRRAQAGIAHVPEGRRVFRELTVEENLDVAAYARRSIPSQRLEDKQRVFTHFPALAQHRGRAAGALSGGQQQMLAIGRALMTRPRALLVDEASLGLAPATVSELFATFRQILTPNLTIILVEQNVRASLAVADRAYVLSHGTVALEGPSAQLMNDDNVLATYLGIQIATGEK